jgi:hypothetical protein
MFSIKVESKGIILSTMKLDNNSLIIWGVISKFLATYFGEFKKKIQD